MLDQLAHNHCRTLISIVHRDAVDTLLAEFQYTLRDNGQRSGVLETLRDESNVLTSRQVDYIYDDLGRLIEEISQSTATSLQYDTKYTLDLVGNRLQKETIQGGDTDVIDYLYNSRDELRTETPSHNGTTGAVTNYDYDLNGSRIEKTTVGGNSEIFEYDLRNRLCAATIDRTEDGHDVHAETAYTYDDSGIRVSSGETITVDSGTPTETIKVFLTDANNPTGYAQVLEERASPTTAPVMTYVIGADVISQASSAATHYLLIDGIGSTRQLITSVAVVAVSFSYDAYGIQITNPSTTLDVGLSNLRYTGEQFDSVLQQTYLRARYQESDSGVFITRDSIAGSAAFPESLHLTLYVQGDPVNSVDFSGHVPLPLLFAGVAGAAAFTSTALDPEKTWWDAAYAGANGFAFGMFFGIFVSSALVTSGSIVATQYALSVGATFALVMGVPSIYRDSAQGKWQKATFDAGLAIFGLLSSGVYLRGALREAMTGTISQVPLSTARVYLAENESLIGWVKDGAVVDIQLPLTSHQFLGQKLGLVDAAGKAVGGAEPFTVAKGGGRIVVFGSDHFQGKLGISNDAAAAVRAHVE